MLFLILQFDYMFIHLTLQLQHIFLSCLNNFYMFDCSLFILQNGMLCNTLGNFCVQAVNGEEGLQDGKFNKLMINKNRIL